MDRFRENHQDVDIHQLKRVLKNFPNTQKGNRELAQTLWRNNHWTRAKFLRMLVSCFDEMGITNQKSLTDWLRQADFDRDVKGQFKTAEHSMGITIFN